MKVAFFGPYIGEFGWEVMTWQAWCRMKSKEFDKSYACSFPDMKYLYEDFAEFIPHKHNGRALSWNKKENIEKAVYDHPDDVTDQFYPPKSYRAEGDFIEFGHPPLPAVRYLLHARDLNRGGKNYPKDKWYEVARSLRGLVASIGSKNDYLIPGTIDLRGIDLFMLARYMRGADYVIGGSSGTMHFACLCGPKIITWGDSRTYFGETLEKRYKETWNPFRSEVEFLFDDKWCPHPNKILSLIEGGSMETADTKQRIPVPQELWDKLVQATGSNRYMVTTHYIDSSGTIQHHWITNNFPKDEMLPSIGVVTADMKEKNQLKPLVHGQVEGKEIITNEQREEFPVPQQLGAENWK